jgi:hypothetical protein
MAKRRQRRSSYQSDGILQVKPQIFDKEERKMRKHAVLLAICLAVLHHVPCAAQTSITVDVSANQGTISPFLYGHSLSFTGEGSGLWNGSTRTIKTMALPVIQDAVQTKTATIRFPGGHPADIYRWRRGVGPLNPVNKRPQVKDYYGYPTDNKFGTDEFAGFCRQITPQIEAMVTANWWLFNEPGGEEYDPVGGRQEAANWVEYCNGVLTQADLDLAASDGWQPTTFVDPESGQPSTDWDAVESADQVHSWKSTQEAKKGDQHVKYFAWLRRFFAWQRAGSPQQGGVDTWKSLTAFSEGSYGAPYGFRYWEIGTEVPGHFWRTDANLSSDEADAYRNSITGTAPDYMGWCKAMKKANSSDGNIVELGYTIEESSAYQGKKLKIGASMDDWANFYWPRANQPNYYPETFGPVSFNLTNNPYRLSVWDTAVLDSESAKFIDFAVTHQGAGTYDGRYSRLNIGPNNSITSVLINDLDGEIVNHFYVRAKASPSGGYPLMEAKLVPVDEGDPIGLKAITPTGRKVEENEERFEVNYQVGGAQAMTQYNADDNQRSDYHFCTELTGDRSITDGDYTLKIEHPADGHGYFHVRMVSHKPGTGAETVQELVEPGVADQTAAVLAVARILGVRTATLRSYLDNLSTEDKRIELAATGYGYAWTFTACPDQSRNLKGLLAVADNFRQLVDNGVDVANYSELNSVAGKHIAQPKGRWDPVLGDWTERDGSTFRDAVNFSASPVQQFLKMLTTHFGDEKVTATVSGSPTFDNPLYDDIAAQTGTPYVTALGSRTLNAPGGYITKVSLLVINKGADELTNLPITVLDPGGAPTGLLWHTLKCWDSAIQGDAQWEAQNDVNFKDRISVRTEYAALPSYTGGEVNLTRTLPARSLTVVELFVRDPAPLQVGEALKAPNSWLVKLSEKDVSAVFSDGFYIQEPNRTSGIAVLQSDSGRSAGEPVTVSGTIITTADGERAISNPTVTPIGGAHTVRTLGMRNKWLGGRSASPYTINPNNAYGLYNVGLLVQTWGEVTAEDPGGTYFYIDDGSNLSDGWGNLGLRVMFPPPQVEGGLVGNYVKVTGISGMIHLGNYYYRALKPRYASDIVKVQEDD